MMGSPYPPQAGPDCFQEFGLDYQPIQASLNVSFTVTTMKMGTYWNSIFDSIVSVGTIFYPIDFFGSWYHILSFKSFI